MNYKELNNFRDWFSENYKWSEIQWSAFANLVNNKNYTFQQLKEATFETVSDSNFKPTPISILNKIKENKSCGESNIDIENVKLDEEFRKKFKKTVNTEINAEIVFEKKYDECSQFQKALLYKIESEKLDIVKIMNMLDRKKTPFIAVAIALKDKIEIKEKLND